MDNPAQAERGLKFLFRPSGHTRTHAHTHIHKHALIHTVTYVCMHLKLHKATRLCRIYYHHLVLLAIAIEMAIYVQILYVSFFFLRIYNDEMHYTDKRDNVSCSHVQYIKSKSFSTLISSRVQNPMLLHLLQRFIAEL